MKTALMTITPAQAKKWLELNTCNRPIRQRHVNFLTDEIMHNRWRLTHQGIALNREHLIDGQHRLLAIVRANRPVECMVSIEVEDDIQDVVDSGSTRSIADQLHLNHDLKNASLVVAACRQIINMFSLGKNVKMSVGLFRIIHAEFARELEVILPIRDTFKPAQFGWTIGTLAFALSANRLSRSFIDQFYSGEHLTADMPAKVARDWIINRKAGSKHNYGAGYKLLSGVYAHLMKTKIAELSESKRGFEYFVEKKGKFVVDLRAEVANQIMGQTVAPS